MLSRCETPDESTKNFTDDSSIKLQAKHVVGIECVEVSWRKFIRLEDKNSPITCHVALVVHDAKRTNHCTLRLHQDPLFLPESRRRQPDPPSISPA